MSKMKVTVCELRNTPETLEQDWQALIEHLAAQGSDLVLLPEMPFSPWLAFDEEFDEAKWQQALDAHEHWLERLPELPVDTVAGTRPLEKGGQRFNQGFIWNRQGGYQAVHDKHFLPDEGGFWEATWFQRGEDGFHIGRQDKLSAGFLICTEMWFTQHARSYGKQGAQLLFCPRATPGSTREKWLAGGQSAAVMAGAYCLSSNFSGEGPAWQWAGAAFIAEPEEGSILGVTSRQQPFLTLEIDLAQAEAAKNTFPRNVLD